MNTPNSAVTKLLSDDIEYLRFKNRQLETQVHELREALQRGMELCERGHGHEWADEARAILEKTK